MNTYNGSLLRTPQGWLSILALVVCTLQGCISKRNSKKELPPPQPHQIQMPSNTHQATRVGPPTPRKIVRTVRHAARRVLPPRKQCYFILVVEGMT